MEVLQGEKDKFKHGSSGSQSENYKRKLDVYHSAAFERVNKALKLSDNPIKRENIGSKFAGHRSTGSAAAGSAATTGSDAVFTAGGRRSDGAGSTGAGSFSPASSAGSPRSSPVRGAGSSRPSSPGGDRARSPDEASAADRAPSRSLSPAHSDRSCPSPGECQFQFQNSNKLSRVAQIFLWATNCCCVLSTLTSFSLVSIQCLMLHSIFCNVCMLLCRSRKDHHSTKGLCLLTTEQNEFCIQEPGSLQASQKLSLHCRIQI